MSLTPEYYYLVAPPILVDDTDPTIRYDNGTWKAANENEVLLAFRDVRPAGTPIFNTLHVLQIFNGSFSYNFTGTHE